MTNSLSIIVFFHFHSFASFQLVLSSSSSNRHRNFITLTRKHSLFHPARRDLFASFLNFFSVLRFFSVMPRARIPVLIFLFQRLLHPLGSLGSSRSGKSLKHSSLTFFLFSSKIGKIPWIFVFHQTLDTARLYFDIKKMQKLISVLCNIWLHLTVTHGSLL